MKSRNLHIRRGLHHSGRPLSLRGPTMPPAGFTLIEVVLVLGVLVLITALAVPALFGRLRKEELPGSARQMRSLLTLVRANAAFDGLRYRVRFPQENEEDPLGGWQQPLVEREDDPVREPGIYNLVTAPWAIGKTVLGNAWCAEVRLGRPTIETLRLSRSEIRDAIDDELEEFEPERPPLLVEPDGTSDWATFVFTEAPRGTSIEELENHSRLEVIYDGDTGLAWIQRAFYDEELDLFEEKNWPVVLRQDFLDPRMLTEDDVLEVRDFQFEGARSSVPGVEAQP